MTDLAAPVSEGVMYYVRLMPPTSDFTESGTVTWAIAPRVYPLALDVGPVGDTPAWLRVNVFNGNPGNPVEFRIDDGETIFEAVLDEDGQVVGTSIPLLELTAGSHTLTVATPKRVVTSTFAVVGSPPSYPIAAVADLAATRAPTPTGVVRWVLQDPTSGGDSYVFPINPDKMSAPYAARVFASEHSTAPNGQPLTFEGAPVGVDWTIAGTVRTQDFYETLETFLAMPRRLYLHDHLRRAWTVSLETINWTHLPEPYNNWSYTYQLKAIIYAGPSQL